MNTPVQPNEMEKHNYDYGANTAIFMSVRISFTCWLIVPDFLQVLIALYLVGVVYLVRRQINQLSQGEEEEDRVVMIDRMGNTNIKVVDKVLSDKNEVFT